MLKGSNSSDNFYGYFERCLNKPEELKLQNSTTSNKDIHACFINNCKWTEKQIFLKIFIVSFISLKQKGPKSNHNRSFKTYCGWNSKAILTKMTLNEAL